MKKRILHYFLALMLVLALVPAATVSANDTISVTIDGQPVVFADQAPTIVDGRTLVPVAGVFQALDFDVQWNGEARQATLTQADNVVVITIDSGTFTVNDANHALDVPAQIIGGRTMLPIAAVLRSVGYGVDWDGATRTVLITSAAERTTSGQTDADTYLEAMGEFVVAFEELIEFLIYLFDILEDIETDEDFLEWIEAFAIIQDTIGEIADELSEITFYVPDEYRESHILIVSAMAFIYDSMTDLDYALGSAILGDYDAMWDNIEDFIVNIVTAGALWEAAIGY